MSQIHEPTKDDWCPCESNRKATDCCLQTSGKWFKKPADTCPPKPKTNLVTSGCYASALEDCDGKQLTREHYISRSLLEQIGDSIVIGGAPWSDGRKISINSLTGNILCKRHNEALSRLDYEAVKLFQMIRAFHGEDTIVTKWLLLCGGDIERWMMKTLFGIFASGNISFHGGGSIPKTIPPLPYLEILFGIKTMRAGWGLRYLELSGNTPRQINYIEITPNTGIVTPGPAHPTVYGMRIGFMGFNLHLSLKQLKMTEPLNFQLYYRPPRFYLGNTAVLAFSWEHPGFDQAIVLEKG